MSRAMPWMAALLPLPALGLAQLAVGFAAHGRPGGVLAMLRASDPAATAMIGVSTIVATLLVMAMLSFCASGRRIAPAAIMLGASLPWLAGVAGMLIGLVKTKSAIAEADGSVRLALLAKGFSEASGARIFGAAEASALLAAVAIGLPMTALGRSSAERSTRGAFATGLASLPLCTAAAVTSVSGIDAPLLVPVFIALAVLVLSGVLSGLALGDDDEDSPARALALSGLIAGALGLGGAAVVALESGRSAAYEAAAGAGADDFAAIIQLAIHQLAPMAQLARYSALALLPAAVIVLLLASNRRVRPGDALGVAYALGVVLLVGAVNFVAGRELIAQALEASEPPWSALAGFEPIGVGEDPFLDEVDGVVARDGSVSIGGSAVDPEYAFPVRLRARAGLKKGANEDKDPFFPDVRDKSLIPADRPEIRLALDARLSGVAFRSLLRIAADSGARTLLVVGAHERSISEEKAERLRDALPLLYASMIQPTAAKVFLAESLPAGFTDRDPLLLHAVIGDGPSISVAPAHPEGGAAEALVLTLGDPRSAEDFRREIARRYGNTPAPPLVYLEFRPAANAASIVRFAEAVRRAGRVPVLAANALIKRAGPGGP